MMLNFVRGETLHDLGRLSWIALMRIARLQGWRSDRTSAQLVPLADEEARSLAAALEAALPDIPAFNARDEREQLDAERCVRNVFQWWSADMREHIEHVWIPFFHAGGCEIVEEPPFDSDDAELPPPPGEDAVGPEPADL